MNRRMIRKFLSIFLIIALCTSFIGCSEDEPEIGEKETTENKKRADYIPDETVTLNMVCDTCSFSGLQKGWFADVLLEKFNVKLNYVYLGDVKDKVRYTGDYDFIFVGACEGEAFTNAVEKGEFLDLSLYDIDKYMPYFNNGLEYLYCKVDENSNSIYGIYSMTHTNDSYEASYYTWDMRFDYYEELGKPEILNINDWVNVLEQMQAAHPTNANGEKVYAISYPCDFPGAILYNISNFVGAYYGYEFREVGYYDWKNNAYYGALDMTDEGDYGAYLSMLKLNNELYKKGLLDPESETQTTDECITKISNEQTLVGMVSWLGSSSNMNMYPVIPNDARISHTSLGMSERMCMAIDSETKYPELCMAIINYLYTPEGCLTLSYGPKGDMWNYDEKGKAYLTELGLQCYNDRYTEYNEYSFSEGSPLMNMSSFRSMTTNPDNGEPFDFQYWESNVMTFENETGSAWGEWVGYDSIIKYMRSIEPYSLIPVSDIDYIENTDLADKYYAVYDIIVSKSWEAIKASTDEEFDRIVQEMITQATEAGYEDCVNYYKEALKEIK